MSVGITMSITLIEFSLLLSHLAIPDTRSRKNEKVICKNKNVDLFSKIYGIFIIVVVTKHTRNAGIKTSISDTVYIRIEILLNCNH